MYLTNIDERIRLACIDTPELLALDEAVDRVNEDLQWMETWVMSGASPSTLHGQTSCWFITIQQRAFVPRAAFTTAG